MMCGCDDHERDPAAVLRAIAIPGLNSQADINYVRHLKLMTGLTPRIGASANQRAKDRRRSPIVNGEQ